MQYEDIELSCVQCGEKFYFTKSEQQHWSKRGFVHRPKRCKKCREERRSRKPNYHQQSTHNIYRAPSFPNEQTYNPGYRSPMGGSWKQHREYEITCSNCGEKDTIHFKPAPNRDIYCHKCYEEIKKSGFRKKTAKEPEKESRQVDAQEESRSTEKQKQEQEEKL